jgi:hypothetical protein
VLRAGPARRVPKQTEETVRNLLLWTHLASVAVFAGATVLLLVLAMTAAPASPLTFAAIRQAISIGAETVAVPALLVMIVSGMLLVVARPLLIDARWVWAKAAAGLAVALVALLSAQPATRRATALAVQEAAGSVLQAQAMLGANAKVPLEAALRTELRGQWITLGLLAAAVGLAVWRPRLGRRAQAAAADGAAAPD